MIESIKKCAVYVRAATDCAREESCEYQERACRSAAEEKRWLIQEDFIFRDACSSGLRTKGRGGLDAMFQALERRPVPFDILLMSRLDRLSRNFLHMLDIVECLASHGVAVYSVEESLDPSKPDFKSLMYTLTCSEWADSLSRVVRRGKKSSARKELSTRKGFG